MFFPKIISFVGVDEKTNFVKALSLSDKAWLSNFDIEWGVLYSPQRAGKQKRYPAKDKVFEFFSRDIFSSGPMITKSIHLCGDAVNDFLENRDVDLRETIAFYNPRIQLNFAISKVDEGKITQDILAGISEGFKFVIQHNKSKKDFIENLLCKAEERFGQTNTFDVLYDGSGGFGRVLENPLPAINGYFTGYAGGLNPENVEEIVRKISRVVDTDLYYIDMESGIRTEDILDLTKCESIIDTLIRMKKEEPFE